MFQDFFCNSVPKIWMNRKVVLFPTLCLRLNKKLFCSPDLF